MPLRPLRPRKPRMYPALRDTPACGRFAALLLLLALPGPGCTQSLEPRPLEPAAPSLPPQSPDPQAAKPRTALPEPEHWQALMTEIRARFPDVPRIGVDAFQAELASGASELPVLLDVRAPEEYRVSHLAGAQRADELDEALAALAGVPRDRPVVVYCSVGYRSAQLAEELIDAGFSNVRNLEGSIFAWANADKPLVAGDAPAATVHPYSAHWGKLLRPELRAEER